MIPDVFMIDGKLYKKITIIRSSHEIVAWCYENKSREWFDISYVENNYI